jgi:hypothetical protein
MTVRDDRLRDCKEKSNRLIGSVKEFFAGLSGPAPELTDARRARTGNKHCYAQRLYIAFQSSAETPPPDRDVPLGAPP